MSYIEFDKLQLINLEYSLNKELIRANRSGSYASTTIIGCNTRKYHGLLVCPQPAIDDENHVLLSNIHETIIQRDAEFNVGIQKYPNTYNPKGHKYIRDFVTEPIPKLTIRVGGVVLNKETLLCEDHRTLIRYTLVEANSPTKMKLRPFLAYRNYHKLSKANVFVEKRYEPIENGAKMRMYQGYSYLHMQFSKNVEYVHVPDWYNNIEYIEEKERGYDYLEDLYTPGFFEVELEKGKSIIFSAGIEEIDPSELIELFEKELLHRTPRNSFENCLKNSAEQFIVKKGKKVEIIAGFPWFGRWGRDTFISLPGLSLSIGNPQLCKEVIDTMVKELKGPLFPNVGSGGNANMHSVDAPLWFFWALQEYADYTKTQDKIWEEYGPKMQLILDGYKNGTSYNIKMQENGLIWAGETGKALTWMDAVVSGKPVTPRIGMPVEINALWYNAIMFSIESAVLAEDMEFVSKWHEIADLIPHSFKETFWDKEKGYLADVVNGDYKDWSVRPNQVIATSLPYSPISEQIRNLILEISAKELLTPRGLRTLSPKDPNYKGQYYGDQATRDAAYHQGTVWPWLLGHYAEGYLKIHSKSGLSNIKSLYKGFEEVMREHGIGSISEVYDGDPPHHFGGAPSQAWSVSELLRIQKLIEKYSNE
ncbi:MAG: glycogen debranching enzyme N-terminal domain-containing protein [Bacteroidetes bacterium]|nr:glycogen debranching enzyme N-terminal domain-containing protein [Bacteroidota bacterium]